MSQTEERDMGAAGPRPLMASGPSRERPGRAPVVASLLMHIVILAGFWAAGALEGGEPEEFVVYEVNLVSPPPQQAGEPQPIPPTAAEPEPEVQEPPAPEPPKVEKPKPTPAPPPPKPKPKPETKPTPPAATPPKTSTPATKPTQGARPDPRSAGGENLDVQIDGEVFPYPGYLENIVRQLYRYFRWDGAPNLAARVYFTIHRDGSVDDIEIVEPSGNFAFDIQVRGAIEAAGRRGAFGALPKEFQGDYLPIRLKFTPPR